MGLKFVTYGMLMYGRTRHNSFRHRTTVWSQCLGITVASNFFTFHDHFLLALQATATIMWMHNIAAIAVYSHMSTYKIWLIITTTSDFTVAASWEFKELEVAPHTYIFSSVVLKSLFFHSDSQIISHLYLNVVCMNDSQIRKLLFPCWRSTRLH